MDKRKLDTLSASSTRALPPAPPSWSYAACVGRALFGFWATVRGLGAFALITFGVIATKFGAAREVTFPAIHKQQARTGTQVLPMFLLISAALGLVVIGQTICEVERSGSHRGSAGANHGGGGRARIGPAVDGDAGAGAVRHAQCHRTGHGPGAGRSRSPGSAAH